MLEDELFDQAHDPAVAARVADHQDDRVVGEVGLESLEVGLVERRVEALADAEREPAAVELDDRRPAAEQAGVGRRAAVGQLVDIEVDRLIPQRALDQVVEVRRQPEPRAEGLGHQAQELVPR